jgi:hypothetical protein
MAPAWSPAVESILFEEKQTDDSLDLMAPALRLHAFGTNEKDP